MPEMPGMGGDEKTESAGPSETAGLFNLSTERRQLIGVRFSEISYQQLEKTIRTVGRVELDQQKIAQVHPKISGWVEDVFVDYQWQHVKKGDPLFNIYSPQLVSAQEEYLLALKATEQLGSENPFPKASVGARSLVEDARTRLRLWDVTDAQIRELERTKQVKRTLTVYSPITGHVTQRNTFPRQWVTPETMVYEIADHSTVWVHVDLYEDEMAWVGLGQTAIMTSRTYPNRVFRGRVTFVWPHLDPATRTLKVRLEFPNPDLALKPEMYSDVVLRIPLGRRLVVPKSAVLPTGKRDLVFVDQGEGRMEIRAIQLGAETEEFYEIVRGLKPGEQVVTAANFLVDAESQVQGAIATWEAQEPEKEGRKPRIAEEAPPPSPDQTFSVDIRSPAQLKVGRNALRLIVRDPTGRPVEDAEVEVTLFMPAMGTMPPMSSTAKLRHLGKGEYAGDIEVLMAATWQTTVTVKKDGNLLGTVRTSLMAR
ncbi:MAG: efflux RND transporter periplasmic adaptor subunit [Acidobacteriota bacterium]